MSGAYYIVLDAEEAEFDTFVNGKAVAHAADELDTLCEEAGLPKLDSFIGQSVAEFADLLGEDIELPDGESGDAEWFDPRGGIALIDSLIAIIRKNPADIDESDAVLDDLAQYRAVLEKACAINAKWHLALDI